MIYPRINKLRMMAIAGLVALAVSSTPARANHGGEFLAPLAAFIAIGALAHHHHGHYRYEYRYHGHHRPHYRPHRPHSHSYGGYGAPRYKHHRNW